MPLPNDFFNRVTIAGTGLIGGSWGLALKRSGFRGHRTGVDRPEVLKKALRVGAIDSGQANLGEAVANADLVVLAAPVGEIIRLLDLLKNCVRPGALISDTGSTKAMICRTARENFSSAPLFVGGHPVTGKERSGIENASADLFESAAYILTPPPTGAADDPRVRAFANLVTSLGAHVVTMDAASHDRALASLSHLPQLVSTALASLIAGHEELPLDLAAAGFRDATRLAGSPYSVWRDICSSNQDNIQEALDGMIRKLETLRNHLADGRLEQEFAAAQRLRKKVAG